MDISEIITNTLRAWAEFLPLPWFAFIGAFVEELTPIPASLIMTILGSLSAVKGHGLLIISGLSLIAAIGKEIGYWLVYFLGDKSEDIIFKNFGHFFGVKHEQVEAIGKHLNKGWRDDLIIFLFRAVPIMPTMPISLICGVLKVNFKSYLIASFFGTLVRNALYLWLGFSGVGILNNGLGTKTWIALAIVLLLIIVLAFNAKKIKSRFKL